MLHTGIGIGIGYWYRQWPILLGIEWLSWYRSNPRWIREKKTTKKTSRQCH